MTELVTLSCNECGAPVEIPRSTSFLTCAHCDSQLQVKHTGSASYTVLLSEIAERTDQLADDVAELKLRQALEDLERAWEREKEGYKVRDKHGRESLPSQAGSIVMGVVMSGFGISWMIFTASFAGPLSLFGLVFIAFAIGGAVVGHRKASDYKRGLRRFRRRHREITRELGS